MAAAKLSTVMHGSAVTVTIDEETGEWIVECADPIIRRHVENLLVLPEYSLDDTSPAHGTEGAIQLLALKDRIGGEVTFPAAEDVEGAIY